MSLRFGSLLLLTVLLLPPTLEADEGFSREKIGQIGKPATVLVECVYPRGRAHGSAFCLHPSGLFATNAHVVSGPGEPNISLILNPGLKNQRVVKAKLVRQDKEKDLALLRAENVKDVPSLPLGSSEGLSETTEIIAFGFPFGTLLSENRDDFPAVSINVGTITSLRHKGGVLNRIQTDAVLNPGNSGGPVLDRNGKVVGVVVAGLRGAGVNFIIPVGHLTTFLAQPELELKLPAVTRADMHKEIVIEARAMAIVPQAKPLRLELLLRGADGKDRKVALEGKDGIYRARFVPVPPPTGPMPVRVTVTYSNGSVTGTTMDRSVRIDGKDHHLSQLRGLRWRPRMQVILGDGKIAESVITGLDMLEVDLGKEVVQLKLAAAFSVQFEVNAPALSVTCTLVALQDDKEVGRVSNNLGVTASSRPVIDNPGNPDTVIKPPVLDQDRVVKTMPAPIADVVVGGGGRYLILHLPQLRKLGIFDISETKIVGYIPLADDNVKFAAGMSKLVVVLPEQNLIQRWDLATRMRELSVGFQPKLKMALMAMGSASQGPLLVSTADGSSASELLFVDVRTLKPLALEIVGERSVHLHADDTTPIRASANGKVFSIWHTNGSPQTIKTLVLEGGKVQTYGHSGTAGHGTPSADGKYLCTGRGLYTQQAKVIGKEDQRNPYLLPAVQGPYYLSLNLNTPGPEGQKHPVTLNLPGVAQPLATLTGLELPNAMNAWDRERFQTDRRIHFIPDAKLLIIIPSTNDKLILHRIDVDTLLEKSDTDYLFVISQPPDTVRKGTPLRYQLAVKSRKGGLTYKVDSGPMGMEATADGLIRWDVPADFKETSISVVLNVGDKSGQEVFQTFKMVIEP